MSKRRSFSSLPARLVVGALPLAALLVSPAAGAHFRLETPASWNSQDASGSPQKAPPCGDDGGTPTGVVTAFQSGQTITINETIFHPGHYRVALAVNDRSELPAEPIVTPDQSSPCGSVPIDAQPAFPVLADGMLLHTQPFSGPQTFEVTLPADVTCEHCTLQIIEFMSNHGLNNPGGCFYHHCADLSISAPSGAGGTGAAGMSAGGSSGTSGQTGATSTAGAGGTVTITGGGAGATSTSTGGSSSTAGHDDHEHMGGSGGASGASASGGKAGAAASGAGGVSSGAGGEPSGESEDDSGCSTSAGTRPSGASALLLGALGWLARRTRRRAV